MPMTYLIGHFSIGFGIVLIMAAALSVSEADGLYLGVVGGLFAIAPDIHQVTFIPESFHDSNVVNIFFGHRLIDTTVETTIGNRWTTVLCISFMLVSLLGHYTFVRYPLWHAERRKA